MCPSDRSRWFAALDRGLARALSSLPPGGPLVVLCSGGVDSALLAAVLRGRPGVVARTAGLPGSPDLAAGRCAAEALGIPWSARTLEPSEVRSRAEWVEAQEGRLRPTERAIETALACAVAAAPPGPIVCGQGADELFFGYDHYRRVPSDEALARAEEDLGALVKFGWPRSVRLAAALEREICAPFLSDEFREAARSIAAPARAAAPPPKALWREYAVYRGVPTSIAGRPKKALQYGSGVDRLLRRGGLGADRPAPERPAQSPI